MNEQWPRQPIPATDYRQTLHDLNQRYHHAWNRAERLQDELEHIKKSRAYRLLCCWRNLAQMWRSSPPAIKQSEPFLMEYFVDQGAPATGTVSIVIPFKDRLDLLRNCLHSLRRGSYPVREIVLLDNGSACPRLLRFLERIGRLSPFNVLHCPGPFNFAKLCNIGARQVRVIFCCF